eukprot:gene8523-10016_t
MGWILEDSSGRPLTCVRIDPSQRSLAFKPDKGGKPTGARAATVGIEAGIRHGAQAATVHGSDAAGGKPQAGQLINVGHELARVLTGHERLNRFRKLLHKGFTHFRADFKGLRTDGRPQPHQYVGRLGIQAFNGRFQYASGQATPAGMGCRDAGTGAIAKQGRHAISRHRSAGDARSAGPTAIGFGSPAGIRLDDNHTVNLAQPGGLDIEGSAETTAIFEHGIEAVLDMIAEI